jgi:hypothetical protein
MKRNPERVRTKRVADAMLKKTRFDIASFAAADGVTGP